MRLINTETLRLHEFVEGQIPSYACLSHRWSDEEISYQQWSQDAIPDEISKGFNKVVSACRTARKQYIKWLWIDTICIDKKSSSELSEAINSMWTWYQNCQVCLVYLIDVNGDNCRDQEGSLAQLGFSEWFTRSWTLQELLAPLVVSFYDSKWEFLGTKLKLVNDLHTHTKIHPRAIINFRHSDWSIAQRMSWASSRKATRTEDIAYSLLGIFDINMPMLYGEGSKAFARLQAEIIRSSTDTSILAWDAPVGASLNIQRALFAESPAFFVNGRSRTGLFSQLQDIPDLAHLSVVATCTITNLGLETTLPSTWLNNAQRQALVAFESAEAGSTPQYRKGCFLWLDHIHGDHYVQRSSSGIDVKVLSSFLADSGLSKLEWQKITISAKPFERVGMAQDRFLLKKYMDRESPLRNVSPSHPQSGFHKFGIIRALGTTPCETVGIWWSGDRQVVGASYVVKFGFDAGHSPMFFMSRNETHVREVEMKVAQGDQDLYANDWMLMDLEMTQHESKAFSWVEHNADGGQGMILHFYSRRGFKVQWKALALELESSGEDETGLEWSLGIRNALAEQPPGPKQSQTDDIEYTLRTSGEEMLNLARSVFTLPRLGRR